MSAPSRWQTWIRSRGTAALVIALVVFGGVVGAREMGWLQSWELGSYDNTLRLRERFLRSSLPDSVVTMVWITETEIQELGHPLEDRIMADALSRLSQLGPRAIGVDVYRDRPTGEGWDRLAEIFRANPGFVIVEKLADDEHPAVTPPAFLPDRSQVGFADLYIDSDGVSRRGLLMLWDEEGTPFLSFSLQLALRHLYADGLTMTADPEHEDYVRLGPTTLEPFHRDFGGYEGADDGGYQYLLDFERPAGSFPGVTLLDLLGGRVDRERIEGKVVILGTHSPSVKDDFKTPLGDEFGDKARIYGAELHAHSVDQLVRYGLGQAEPLAAWSDRQESAWILVWCLLGAAVGMVVRSTVSLFVAAVLGVAVLLGIGGYAFLSSLWLPIVAPAGGGLASLALVIGYSVQQERADKEKAKTLWGRFLSKKLVDQIWLDRDQFMHGDRPMPQRVTVTVMLTDLSGYTSRSEKKEPAEVMDWIGTYMDRMADLVESHGGIVNDFLGDGLMASFGVPVPSTTDEEIDDDTRRAVDCALAMGRALEELNARWLEQGEPTARMRIGIYTGPAVVGAIGSRDRMKYATVGNTVNTASRLESHDKLGFEVEDHVTWRVLAGQPTWERLHERYVGHCIGEHVLKGKGEPVTIYRVLGGPRPDPAAAPD